MKRLIALVATLALTAGLFAGCAKKEEQKPAEQTPQVKIGLATDEGGKGDKSFNDAAIAGLEKIKAEYGIEPQIIESKTADDYEPNLTTLAADNDLVFGVGFKMADAIKAVAENTPDKKFAIIDSVVDLPNVASFTFKEEEGSFLMGIIAGKMTKTNTVGFLGGIKFELIEKFEAGFRAGVKAVNPNAKVLVQYANSFSDVALGYEISKKMYNDGADVIYHAAGGVGIGLFNAAKEMKKWAIGVDSDQAVLIPDKADVILASMIKRVDTATYTASKAVIDGTYKPGLTVLGLKEDGVGISQTINPAVPQEVIDLANKYKQAIIDGKFTVPTKPAEVDAFQAPQI
ncbi:Membrane lipoprotein TmpC precursor [Caloramator mitchellensis]|uniref:Membrane lipoprotein TmpC n=1 Tax=Caloramator mitchellensis TaxID=908809 RepID=A0A0R3K391_CALMK|nr:BMP family ABC transporter substrate-binding protein [Caloramator mitchellensis]KRQ88030.1 Membrane lipoprotein TmpC precursor [Caloramator mitchellensis]